MLEGRIKRLHRKCVRSYRTGTDHRWCACLAASRIVGEYRKGETSALAKDLRLSPDRVQDLARAGWVYRKFRKFGVDSETRKALSPTHFARMGDMAIKYDLSPADVVETLRTAATEGSSVRQMIKFVTDENEPLSDIPSWREMWNKIWKLVNDMLNEEIPPDIEDLLLRMSADYKEMIK